MIRIMVDSASDCGKKEFDVFMPIKVRIDDREYRDGIDIDADGFYEKLLASEGFPQTSQPSPQDFLEIFRQIRDSDDELIYIALSSGVSGTWQGACIAKEMVDCDRIHIIDSLGVTHMIRILAEHARALVEQGLSAREIVRQVEALRSRVRVLAGVDTLEYLYRGGRLSRTTAAVGQIAGIKPIITATADGHVENVSKCLGRARAMQFILDRMEATQVDESFPLYTLYTCGLENLEILEEKLAQTGYTSKGRLQIGSSIGAHAGPGVYAVVYVTK